MSHTPSHDVAALLAAVSGGASNATPGTPGAGAPALIVAGGAGDGVEIVGDTIDRETYGMPLSCLVAVHAHFSLADTEELAIAVSYQESADGTTWDTAVVVEASDVKKTASGAEVGSVVVPYHVTLSPRKRYIRFNVTPDLSAGSTDSALLCTTVVLGGLRDSRFADTPAARA